MHSAIAQFEPPSRGPSHHHVPARGPGMGWRFEERRRRHIDHHRIPIAGRSMAVRCLDKTVAGSGMWMNSRVLLVVDMSYWVEERREPQGCFGAGDSKLPREAQRP